MLAIGLGVTEELDAEPAAAELVEACAAGLRGRPPDAGIVVASHDADLRGLVVELNAAYPGLQLLGCTAVAPLTSADGCDEGATALALLGSDTLGFRVGLGPGAAADPAGAARRAVADARRTSEVDPALCLVMTSVDGLDPVGLTAALEDALPPGCVLFGGGSHPVVTDTYPWEGSAQVCGEAVVTDAVAVLLVDGPLEVSVGVGHGWSPVGKPGRVTVARGDTVETIDGAPALSFYRRTVGSDSGRPALAIPMTVRERPGARPYLRTARELKADDGSISFLGSVPEGSTVQFAMTCSDDLLAGAEQAVREALEGWGGEGPPDLALVASCTIRNILLGTRADTENARIRAVLGDVPVAGFYAFGEIGPIGPGAARFHNDTCLVALLGGGR